MPNHIMNLITLSGDERTINEIREQFKQEDIGEGSLDFQKLIPMPESLNIEASTKTDFGMKLYLIAAALDISEEQYAASGNRIRDVLRHTDYMAVKQVNDETLEEDLKIGKIAVENIRKYGVPDGYDWCIENWGTKWNSYETFGCEDQELRFYTAWSAPHPVIEKLSELYPEITIVHQWADENMGYNLGQRDYLAGQITYEMDMVEGSEDALRFACELFVYDYDELIREWEEEEQTMH